MCLSPWWHLYSQGFYLQGPLPSILTGGHQHPLGEVTQPTGTKQQALRAAAVSDPSAYNMTIQLPFFLLNTVFSKATAILLLNITWKLWQIPQTSHLPYWGLPWALRKQTKSKPTIKVLFAWHSAALMIFVCKWKTAAFSINKNILIQETECLFWKKHFEIGTSRITCKTFEKRHEVSPQNNWNYFINSNWVKIFIAI